MALLKTQYTGTYCKNAKKSWKVISIHFTEIKGGGVGEVASSLIPVLL